MDNPTTKVSLILKLRNNDDAQSWEEFVQIYEPTIHRIAVRLGLGAEEATDACQSVMVKLSNSIGKWSPDSKEASFRKWLYRVARNTILNHIKSNRRDWQSKRSSVDMESVESAEDLDSILKIEFLRQALVYLASKIKPDFDPTNWSAFWLTYGQKMTIDDAAEQLGISKSRVYVARSRIIRRLKEEAGRLSESAWLDLEQTVNPASSLTASEIARICDPDQEPS